MARHRTGYITWGKSDRCRADYDLRQARKRIAENTARIEELRQGAARTTDPKAIAAIGKTVELCEWAIGQARENLDEALAALEQLEEAGIIPMRERVAA